MFQEYSGEKTENATSRRRLEARRKGIVAKSLDLSPALILLGLTVILPVIFSYAIAHFLGAFRHSLLHIPQDLSNESRTSYFARISQSGLMVIVPILLIALITGLLANFGQVGFVLSPKVLKPSLSRISPIIGFKRLVSAKSLFEVTKTVLKFILFACTIGFFINFHLGEIVGLIRVHPIVSIGFIGSLLNKLFLYVALIWLVVALCDYYYQRKQVEKQLRMSKYELKRELREQEISPELRRVQSRHRRKFLKGLLINEAPTVVVRRGYNEVPLSMSITQANAIITDANHFAVAVRYARHEMDAPVVVMKGYGFVAQRMKEIATRYRIPIVPNSSLARELYNKCGTGQNVPSELYKAVAEVLVYAYTASQTIHSNT